MEGLILGTEAFGSALTFIAALSLLIIAVSAVFFGYMAEEEKKGRRFHWAEWPVNETEETAKEDVVRIRLAA